MAALWVAGAVLAQEPASTRAALEQLEGAYADFNDAAGAVSLIDSNPARYHAYGGRSRRSWQQEYVAQRAQLVAGLAQLPLTALAAADARAVTVMRAALEESEAEPHSLAPVGHCRDATHAGLKLLPLQQALYGCFTELANSLHFEHGTVTRVAAFALLTSMQEPERRRALFLAFVPLWRALNGDDGAGSPYRRMIRMAAAAAARGGSPVDAAAGTLGVPSTDIEQWLERILDTWRRVSAATPVEPWDYRYQGGAAERELGDAIPRAALRQLNDWYYLDLGLDLAGADVRYDLDPRTGKAPLAYTDYVRRGRLTEGHWQPTLVRISASYGRGGLGPLNELVHESGHAAHMLALRTRPAFMDLGDPLFYEAFADVPSWSVYEPAWQRKYLGRSAPEAASLRALYSGVMLDAAWALFDLRMLRRPEADPNAVWTDITSRYLHVIPHPELAWWAVRVQLVDKPGYMVNYGLGAVITADIRARIAARLGPFATGDPRWYGWVAAQLLASGEEHPTAQLLREFLGRPVTPDALLAQLQRAAARN
ncbi:MAG TPA: hypothetical protein VET66_02765 [Steroidobacteraceae bacterium]|nr:hypothetical protein [Steroidobacteraceae bacterium]